MEDHEHRTDEKYIVFRRDEFYMMMGGFLPTGDVDCAPVAQAMQEAAEKTKLEDAVVIRLQDVFASPTLSAYASMIQAAARGMRQTFEDLRVDEELAGPLVKRLSDIADYFHDRASETHSVKLPD